MIITNMMRTQSSSKCSVLTGNKVIKSSKPSDRTLKHLNSMFFRGRDIRKLFLREIEWRATANIFTWRCKCKWPCRDPASCAWWACNVCMGAAARQYNCWHDGFWDYLHRIMGVGSRLAAVSHCYSAISGTLDCGKCIFDCFTRLRVV